MTQVNIPPGMSSEAIAAALDFVKSQMEMEKPRPTGILPQNMIRGVNKNYKYVYREYPKALVPPDVEVASEQEERKLRVRWKTPLPWSPRDADGGSEYIAEYYAARRYPLRMTPPAVIVQDETEEQATRAGWQAEFGSTGGIMYPAWFFHAQLAPALVGNVKEREKLGDGWYPTPMEAVNAARGQQTPKKAKDELERAELLELAKELDVRIDARMKTARVRQLVRDAQEAKVEFEETSHEVEAV